METVYRRLMRDNTYNRACVYKYEYGYMYLVICDVDYDETINDYSVGKYVEEIVADETYIEEM